MSRHEIYVPSNGPRNARIAIVGESPGVDEIRIGRGFVGRAGVKLDEWLAAAGIHRDACFITNVVHYLPTDPKEKYFIDDGPTDAYVQGIMELVNDLREIRPNVVAAFGNYALYALTGEWGIWKWRGSILESKILPGMKVVPVVHPAAILRGQLNKQALCVWDLQRIAGESAFPDIVRPEREYVIFPNAEQIESAVDRLLHADLITFDIECYTPDLISCISFSDSPTWAICIPFESVMAKEACRRVLESNVPKVNQNVMFDVTLLYRNERIDVKNVIGDTMIAQHCTWTDIKENSLATIVSIYTSEPYYKDDVDFQDEPRDKTVYYTYSCKDSACTFESYEAQQHELDNTRTRAGYETTMSIFHIMARATNIGIRADVDKFHELRDAYTSKADKIEAALGEYLGEPFNPKSSQQTAVIVYDVLGIKERAKRTTKKEVLLDVAAQLQDADKKLVVEMIVRAREARDAVSKYLRDDLIDPDGRIRCHWRIAGTESGRLSSAKTYWGSGVNLQTIPDPIRSIFIPDPGHVFIIPDYEQAEARWVAYESEDEDLIEMLEAGQDIHAELASFLYDVGLDECGKGTKIRYLAKRCRHGFNYKMGPDTFKLTVNKDYLKTGIGITAAEAKTLRERFMSYTSALSLWWKQIESELRRNNGQLVNSYGRRRRFLGFWGDALLREAISFKPQASIVDMTTKALVKLSKCLPDAMILVHTHDGGLTQVPEDLVDTAVPVIKDCFNVPLRLKGHDVKIPVEIKVGYDWKSAETINV